MISVFFYHSNIGKEIVGIVEVVREFYPDKTDQSGRFVAVNVKFKKKFFNPISLERIKKSFKLLFSELRYSFWRNRISRISPNKTSQQLYKKL